MSTIGFVGGGNMAISLIGGLIDAGHPGNSIWVSEPLYPQREALGERFAINITANNIEAVAATETLVLAVKPQIMQEVVQGIAEKCSDTRPLIISIAAGVQESSLLSWLGYPARIVRCMPNTPALLGCGATALYGNSAVSPEDRERAGEILGTAGIALWVDSEDLIDAVTAVSGSGPAYFFMLMEHMIVTGQNLGLSKELATELTLQTALGAARMAKENNDSPGDLRRKVTSPGGTTERALDIFTGGGIATLIEQALTGARDRSRELGKAS